MTDSMNFGPDWIRNLSSEGSTGGGTGGIGRYQLADYRYGREEMLALFDRNIKPPACLANFKSLYSEITLPPLALLPTSEEERVGWQGRPSSLGGPPRGRGTSLDRGGRVSRGRGGYQSYGRPPYEGGWGNGESSDWSPRKEYNARPSSMDNWRRARNAEEDDGWRMTSLGRGGMHEKWGRQSSWRGDGEDERIGGPERGGRWNDPNRNPSSRKSWDNEDHLPEWANENPGESGGSFDDRGAFHGSDDEQSDLGKSGQKKEGLQKSTSQQHISHKTHPPLLTSKSTMSLVKDIDYESIREDKHSPNNPEFASRDGQHLSRERKLSVPEAGHTSSKETVNSADRAKSEGPPKTNDVQVQETIPKIQDKVEVNDFERLQEDFVSKLVVDEEPPKQDTQVQGTFELPNLAPPLNLAVPGQDKWFYLDPQGQIQGPFTNAEMTEWFKAGYFGHDLKVRRQCDERFYLLGELMAMCNGNPFESSMRFPVLKNDISKIPEQDRQYPFVAQMQAFKQAQARVLADPWSTIAVQQQELAAQRLIIQQQQVPPDLPYVQEHPPPANPLMHMINQMQQANKLPPTGFIDKQPPNLTGRALDPHLHMSHYLSLQNRLPGALANHQIPPALSSGMPGPPEVLAASLPGAGLGAGLPLQSGINSGLGLTGPPGQPVEANPSRESDPITKLLKQLHQGKQQPSLVESFWQPNQFGSGAPTAPQQQWPSQNQSEAPMSMWDMQQPPTSSSPVQHRPKSNELPRESEENILSATKLKKTEKSKDSKQNDDEKEIKKKKKIDEEQQKKDAEEKRKQEQRKLEFERKAEIEKKKKEEERIKKELDKAKKEAEEKRLRELEEKRRLKEQRKLEEVKKKSDEDRRKLEDEMIRREKEQREREERQRMEEKRQEQISLAKAAPWSQANSTFGMSLAEIQKAEKERKAQEAALQAQKAQEKELQLQQQQLLEKSSGSQMGWAKKNMEPRKVKSLAEIQAEEQERLAKEAAEARLKKEKEARETVQIQTTNTIWSGQSLNWASASSAQSQWTAPTNNSGGFWDEPTQKPQSTKPSNVTKSSSMSTINRASKQPQKHSPEQQPQKPKAKKEEATSSKKNHNNNVDDEFTNWCYKSLSSIDTNVDVPTFVTFLRDIESAFEVREYCKMYLGENNATQQFTNNFLEKRRSFKPKNAHTDDMCSPAPAITPSMHNSTEFQEVKGKNKKSKKSKMLKVDSRILGFNVTSAPDRINVGDRDYGDNS